MSISRAASDSVRPLLRSQPVTSVQGTLALDLVPAFDPDSPLAMPGSGDPALRQRLEAWSRRYAQAVADIVAGARPLAQIKQHTTPRLLADIARRAHLVHLAAGDGARRNPGARGHVLSTHVFLVGTTAAEVSIHLRHGERSRATAARFEVDDAGRWICVAYDFA